MTFTPVARLCVLGGMLFAALYICSRSTTGTGSPSFLIPLVVAGAVYLLAMREFFVTQKYPRQVIFACLALAVAWRVPFLLQPSKSNDDVRRYVWDGRLQRLGYNPYTAVPADPKLDALHTPETRGLNNPDVPSPYPAGAQLFFRGVAAVSETTFAFKVAFVVCDLAVIFVLLDTLRRAGQKEHWVLSYAWHPLLATDVAGSGHIDIVGALLLLLSVAAIGRRWRTIAAIMFGLAVAVKFLPLVLTPVYWRRVRVRDGLVAALVVAMLYVPFLVGWHIPAGSLGIFLQRFRFNDPIFPGVERLAGPFFASVFAVLVGLATGVWLRKRHNGWWSNGWAWPMAASLACAPVIYPWYLIWLLPFLSSFSTLALLFWTVTILPTYFVWHLRTLGGAWHVPLWITVLEYLPVLAAAIFVLTRTVQMPVTRIDEFAPKTSE